jgi:hypothetical protein
VTSQPNDAARLGALAISSARAGNIDLARRVAAEAAAAYRAEAEALIARGRAVVAQVNELLEAQRIDDCLPPARR